MTELGTALRGLRTATSMTQEQLAERSGVSVRTIRRLENGALPDPRLATINQLAAALGVAPHVLNPSSAGLPADAGTDVRAGAAPAPAFAPRSPFHVHGVLEEAAGELAREIRRRWRREEDQSRVRDPFHLPVRWRPAPADLVDRSDNIQRLGPGAVAEPLDLSGDLSDVALVHRRIPSGRLVVLGRAGAGKSVLAIRLALDLLESGCSQVPVIFSLGAWDPTTTSLPDWLVGQLLRDHPHLARRSPGGAQSLAEALIHCDAVLPVLDGFDEIAEGLRAAALRELNTTSSALVVTTRREEFADAVRVAGAPLAWAAGIELGDITTDDLAHYLPRTARDGNAHGWDRVLTAARDPQDPAGARLAEALSTPLMVALARVLYSDGSGDGSGDGSDEERGDSGDGSGGKAGPDPAELLDADRFPDTRSLEEHLLKGFVPTLYRMRPPEPATPGRGRPRRAFHPDQAGRWLGYLAHGLATHPSDRHDLAWWQLGDSMRRSSRTLAVVLTTAACLTVSTWLVGALIGALIAVDPVQIVLLGLLLGPVAGLAFGCVYAVTPLFGRGSGIEPSRTRLRLRGHQQMTRRPRRALTAHLGAILLGGFVMGAGFALALTLERSLVYHFPLSAPGVLTVTLINIVVFALIFGTAATSVFGLLTAFQAPLDTSSTATPSALLASNRAETTRQLLVLAALLAGAITGIGELVTVTFQGTLGPLIWGEGGIEIGVIGGVGGAAAYVFTFTAWGQWLVLVRFWLPLTGRLPWNTAAFLDDAYGRGALRRSGAVYQFRHVRLQHHLARAHRAREARFADADLSDPAAEARGEKE
ncbi:helix-turn-helix domain-containing protein [Streptacidiphilus jiangxiensis]|uniref:NACHT domain-containing protein n=1 Tax=Streptacidiphilus jiangxiensis TaxID=235985 RepID=A0A1H7MU22_STRJI|nr:helix-turn-helix domain-containing protein [Streptacidiphilus jiangxiensis]SEL14549.1 NACHT domain-containing protein [Streptacidiphilus jiangxiensis]